MMISFCSPGFVKDSGMTTTEFVQLAKDVLAALWNRDIVHRDIKLENLRNGRVLAFLGDVTTLAEARRKA